jgi:nitrile hydratase beta subunit
MNGIHDVGGMDGLGPMVLEENEPVFHEPWEAKVRALSVLVNRKRHLYYIDESRHTTERIDPVYYMGSGYYQLWLLRLETMLMEKGVLMEKEIEEKMQQFSPGAYFEPALKDFRKVRPHNPSAHRRFALPTSTGVDQPDGPIIPKYSPGMTVWTKVMAPLGHTRIPRYVRGKQGVIDAIHGNFVLPDIRVEKGINLYQPVYRVRFDARDLWGEDAAPNDKLYIELWEDYLEFGGINHE